MHVSKLRARATCPAARHFFQGGLPVTIVCGAFVSDRLTSGDANEVALFRAALIGGAAELSIGRAGGLTLPIEARLRAAFCADGALHASGFAGLLADEVHTALRTALRAVEALLSVGGAGRASASAIGALLRAAIGAGLARLIVRAAARDACAILAKLRTTLIGAGALRSVRRTNRGGLTRIADAGARAALEIEGALSTIALAPNRSTNVVVALLIAAFDGGKTLVAVRLARGGSAHTVVALL